MDLLSLARQDTGAEFKRSARTHGGEYTGPCPLCRAGDDRFHVWPNHPRGKARWWCRICGKDGDLADYLQLVHGMSVRESLEAAGLSTNPPYGDAKRSVAGSPYGEKASPTRRSYRQTVKPPPAAWQERAGAFVQYAQSQLWGETGYAAREYLKSERVLLDETIRHYGLGYNPKAWYRKAKDWGLGDSGKVYLSPGIVIPCQAGETLQYVQIRRPCEGDPLAAYLEHIVDYRPEVKYWAVKGGCGRALFGVDDLRYGGLSLLLCEGEFDAMLAWQEVNDLVDVATLGGASKSSGGIPTRWLLYLLPYRQILIGYDTDGAGNTGAARMLAQTRRAVRIRVPQGSDLTDYQRLGYNLRSWLERTLAQTSEIGKEDGE